MTSNFVVKRLGYLFGIAAIAALLALNTSCARADYPRGQFTGYVMNKTEDEVTEKIGKPSAVDKSNPDKAKWVYKDKTFDPDNGNKPDKEAILIFQRDAATGKLKVGELEFN